MPLFRKGFLLLACLFGLLANTFAANIRASGATVVVNEVPVLALKTSGTDGATPAQRAERLVLALESAITYTDVKTVKEADTQVIFLGSVRVLTVTAKEASAHRTSMAKLAATWAANLRSAFALPGLKLSVNKFRTPPSTSKVIKMVGSWAHMAEAAVDDPNIASVAVVPGGLKIQAISPGTATVNVSYPDGLQTVEVEVRAYAANLPQTVSATVTGSPALASTVQGAVEGAIRTQLKTVPNATLKFNVTNAQQIQDGSSKTFVVKVTAEAPESFDRTGNVNVVVRNVPAGARKDSELWYCNHPENVKQAGPLFSAPLRLNAPARLLYHHINSASYPLFLRIQAINDTDIPAKVVLIPGDSSPDPNPVRAGMRAALQYFKAWASGSGEVVTIPPRSTLPISLRRMGTGDTVSGLCGLRLIEGPNELQIRTDAWPPFPLDPKWNGAIQSSTPWREVGTHAINSFDRAPFQTSDHIYPNPYKVEEVAYEVGGRYGFVRIGQRPIARSDRSKNLDGNFGVIYNIKANLENKTQEATDVEVVFETSAGYSGGLFLLNGEMIETPLMQPKAERQIAKYRLMPGMSKRLDIVTVPLSGSSYPATITIRPVQTLSPGFNPTQ